MSPFLIGKSNLRRMVDGCNSRESKSGVPTGSGLAMQGQPRDGQPTPHPLVQRHYCVCRGDRPKPVAPMGATSKPMRQLVQSPRPNIRTNCHAPLTSGREIVVRMLREWAVDHRHHLRLAESQGSLDSPMYRRGGSHIVEEDPRGLKAFPSISDDMIISNYNAHQSPLSTFLSDRPGELEIDEDAIGNLI